MKLKNHYKSEFNSSFYLLSNFEIKIIIKQPYLEKKLLGCANLGHGSL